MFLSVFIVSNRNPQFGIMAVAIVFCFYTVVTLCGGEGGAEEDSSHIPRLIICFTLTGTIMNKE